jgi:hypothetical protein
VEHHTLALELPSSTEFHVWLSFSSTALTGMQQSSRVYERPLIAADYCTISFDEINSISPKPKGRHKRLR